MSSRDSSEAGPPLPERAGPFGALLVAAAREPAAAHGLALAYAALPPGHRKQLVDAVVTDARTEGVCPSLVLASLLSVEEHTGVAEYIAESMSALDTQEVSGAGEVQTFLAGDEQRGALLVVRPLHGTFVEALGLAWDAEAGISHALFEPLVHHQRARQLLDRLPAGEQFEQIPLPYAMDLVAAPLWHHRRLHGALPVEIERFADLFSCSQTGRPAAE